MNHELGSRGQEDSPSLDGRGEGRVLGISYDSLSAEVRPYADNLEAQVWAVFAKYGVTREDLSSSTGSTEVNPPHEAADELPPDHPLHLLKAKDPSLEDLEHLSDLLEQLNYIRINGVPSERTKREYHDLSLEFSYNETEAKRLGLEKVEVKGYPEADALIEQVIDGTIDIETTEGQAQFIEAWNTTCPDLPPPCLPDLQNFWYLVQLKNKRIISNLEGDPEPATPRFSEDEVLLIDSWEETDWDAPDASTQLTSSLIKELLGQESVVKIRRQDLEVALWQGDPKDRLPTLKHLAILEKLNMPPDDFELRPIRQDEYARLAKEYGWGAHNLWTNFDHYFLEDDGARGGLGGGHRGLGGLSDVGSNWRGGAYGRLAVRLVLARKPRI